jgi:hypothetical protein
LCIAVVSRTPPPSTNSAARLAPSARTTRRQTWHDCIVALNGSGLDTLNTLFDVAIRFDAKVTLIVLPARDHWMGRMLTQIGDDLIAALAKEPDATRPGHRLTEDSASATGFRARRRPCRGCVRSRR